MSQAKTLIIGGFALGAKVVESLTTTPIPHDFIDINCFLPPFTLDSLALLIEQKLSTPTTVIAYSCGGLLALQLLALAPHKIQRLILLNSTPYFMQHNDWQGITEINHQQLQRRLARGTVEEFVDYFIRLAASPHALHRENLTRWSSPYANQSNLLRWLEIIAHSDLRKISNIFARQIVWFNADQDVLIPAPQQIPASRIIANSTHLQLNSKLLVELTREYL